MDFFKYFQEDTRRTFPVPTEKHAKDILEALKLNRTFDGYISQGDEEEVGALALNFKDIILTGLFADVIKAGIFYGKYKDYESEIVDFGMDLPLKEITEISTQHIELIHSLLGIVSESAELLKALLLSMTEGKELDVANLKEEYGDIIVYAAAGCNAVDLTIKDCMDANVKKRAIRFPQGFTQFDAINRDLGAERKVLEQ